MRQNNVLLDADCTARLTDFGYSSLVGNIPEALTYLRRSTTRPGALRWIAPEQIIEDLHIRTTKSDIYSFGCIGLQASLLRARTRFALISSQTLSGKQPWSEIREDAAVVLRLAKGHNPSRPASRPMDDLHWDLIEHCWSSVEERPTSEAIISSIEQFLSYNRPFLPLCDFMGMSDDSSLPGPACGEAPADGLYTDNECEYVATFVSVYSNMLTCRNLHLSLPGRSSLVRLRQEEGLMTPESCATSPYKRRRV